VIHERLAAGPEEQQFTSLRLSRKCEGETVCHQQTFVRPSIEILPTDLR
jgi:hypothetical protein